MNEDTMNRFLVSAQGGYLRINRPLPGLLSRTDALNLAAWLVALADENGRFVDLLERVQGS